MKVSGTRCYTRYTIGTEYNFGCEGYWWGIKKSNGKYIVTQNGLEDKSCSSYLKACRYMDKIKAMVQE